MLSYCYAFFWQVNKWKSTSINKIFAWSVFPYCHHGRQTSESEVHPTCDVVPAASLSEPVELWGSWMGGGVKTDQQTFWVIFQIFQIATKLAI